MLLLSETKQTELGETAPESAIAVYRNIAPVFARFHGTTVPSAVTTVTAQGTVGGVGIDTTDMGVATLSATAANGRVRAFAGLGWQPVGGSKRHGATRGRPPRAEHRMGLQRSPLGALEAANPATGIAAFLFGSNSQVAARQ